SLPGTAVSSPIGNSSTPKGTEAEVMFMLKRRSQVASEQVNSPVSSAFLSESLRPDELNMTKCGFSPTALKKLYGPRLQIPSLLTVAIQPIGRGPTMALNGSCLRPCLFSIVS